ncbi:hypothetical protein GGI35DRAFT_463834 [Trichoderma velutinum]
MWQPSVLHPPPMAPRLSKAERRGLQAIIISKLQSTENTNDSEIAGKIIPYTTRSICNALALPFQHFPCLPSPAALLYNHTSTSLLSIPSILHIELLPQCR